MLGRRTTGVALCWCCLWRASVLRGGRFGCSFALKQWPGEMAPRDGRTDGRTDGRADGRAGWKDEVQTSPSKRYRFLLICWSGLRKRARVGKARGKASPFAVHEGGLVASFLCIGGSMAVAHLRNSASHQGARDWNHSWEQCNGWHQGKKTKPPSSSLARFIDSRPVGVLKPGSSLDGQQSRVF
ncbi:hypothetical protein IWX49DRAFT_112026 [Phyllosticta citricarpa]|uniref:Secreted protein n=2 Tax=Phyllosticta TaxID=121621 RepID=A0ABR1ME82_9PEZI